MLARGVLTEEQLDRALKMRGCQRKRFGDILVEQGFCTPEDVLQCLADQFQLPTGTVKNLRIQSAALRLVSGSFALNHLLLPIRFVDGVLEVFFADPVDIEGTDLLREKAGVPLKLTLATSTELRSAIRKAYKLPSLEVSGAEAPKRKLKIDAQIDRQALIIALDGGGLSA